MIATIGELLVEFIAEGRDGRHLRPDNYAGPFPSGAPGIFADQVARVAGQAMMAGTVGRDGFGQVIRDRLIGNGVLPDLLGDSDRPTGTAHVSYNSDGSRDFVFNIAHSAAAELPAPDRIVADFRRRGVSLLHISGVTLADPGMRATILAVLAACPDLPLSIDPNYRPEIMANPAVIAALRQIIARADFVLPSDADAEALWPDRTFADWAGELLSQGARAVVLKRGDRGCIGIDAGGMAELPGHAVAVRDPTGAGDCFCATFVALMTGGAGLTDALAHANAAGALAVQALGPMEGNSSLSAIRAQLDRQPSAR
jgi:sugar/nucleoside kinase (ribokinase family)